MATTFTVSSGSIMRPYRNTRIEHFPEAASQSFKNGYPLIMDAAGTENRVKVAADQVTSLIVGVAAQDASGVAGTMIGVYLAEPMAEFIAVGKAAQAMDYTDLSVGLAILKDATNLIWYIDNTDTSHDAVVPLKFLPPAVQGDFQGYYIFRFAQAACLYGSQVV